MMAAPAVNVLEVDDAADQTKLFSGPNKL